MFTCLDTTERRVVGKDGKGLMTLALNPKRVYVKHNLNLVFVESVKSWVCGYPRSALPKPYI